MERQATVGDFCTFAQERQPDRQAVARCSDVRLGAYSSARRRQIETLERTFNGPYFLANKIEWFGIPTTSPVNFRV